MKVSIYERCYKPQKPIENIELSTYFDHIKNGRWQDDIHEIRTEQDKKKRQELKKNNLGQVTLSGTFGNRSASGLQTHNKTITLDIDDFDGPISTIREKIEKDPFVYACFLSCSGQGLAVTVKIKSDKKHLEHFLAIENYFYDSYGIIIDPSGKDVCRGRFFTYDPNIYINENSEVFTNTFKPKKKKIKTIVFHRNDIDHILQQIRNSGIDLTPNYHQWRDIGFALASEFGESGVDIFQAVSQQSHQYNEISTEKQFKNCVKSTGHGITIATFFHYCKEAGIEILTKETIHITAVAKISKESGATKEQAIERIQSVTNQTEERSKEIVDTVYKMASIGISTEELTLAEEVEFFCMSFYDLAYNTITANIEVDGIPLDDRIQNQCWLDCNKTLKKDIPKNIVRQVMWASSIRTYNPIVEFIEKNKDIETNGELEQLLNTVESEGNQEFNRMLIKKWYVSMFSFLDNSYSPLSLVFTGKHGDGKSYWFQNLIPKELKPYYTESKLDKENDALKQLHSNILILNDEYGGGTVKDANKFKELISKNWVDYRGAYKEHNVKAKRIALIAGTSNDDDIINDATGNRRVLPVRTIKFNHELYNSIDKTKLFIEAYNIYKSGWNWTMLGEDIAVLNEETDQFRVRTVEEELISKMYRPFVGTTPKSQPIYLTATEIMVQIQSSKIGCPVLKKVNVGRALKALNFKQKARKINGSTVRCYEVSIAPTI